MPLRTKDGASPRWWENENPRGNGKAKYQCNVPGVTWEGRKEKWRVQNTDANTGKQVELGTFAAFEDACAARATAVDGKVAKGALAVVDGQLCVTHCAKPTCRRTNIPIAEFAPSIFEHKKLFSEFANTLALLIDGLTNATCAEIDKRRRTKCLHCRDVQRKTQMHGEHNETAKCRIVVAEIKAQWATNGGCGVCHTRDVDVLSGDHEDRKGKRDQAQTLNPHWWSVNGGADALRAHYIGDKTNVKCLCLFCHSLESSHNFHFGANPESLNGKRDAKYSRENRLAKGAHVNAEKMRRGKCEHPLCRDPRTGQARVVTETTCHGFHFAHKDEVDKEFGIATMVHNRQSPATAIPKLDKEMPKCNIYCANCHHKYDTLPRRREGRELLDVLLERGAPVGIKRKREE